MKIRLADPWYPGSQISKMLSELYRDWGMFADDDQSTYSLMLPVDLWEDDKNYYAEVQMPGVMPDDIDISLDNRYVTVKVERKLEVDEKDKKGRKYHMREIVRQSYQRTFTLPGPVDHNGVKAKLKDGVLHLTFPKSAETVSKKIKVE